MSCDDGSYAFQGIHAQTVHHKNMKFDIRVRGPMIEALRINAMGFPSARQVRPIALQAMRQVVAARMSPSPGPILRLFWGFTPVTFNTVFFA